MKLTKIEEWSGKYKGVIFSIKKWFTPEYKNKDGEIIWPLKEHSNYYLHLRVDNIDKSYTDGSIWLSVKENLFGRPNYDYENNKLIRHIWFHGGCTYYSKETSEDIPIEDRTVKIGCDYDHYNDENIVYTLNDIIKDVKNSIESFLELSPNYKLYCPIIGGYWDKSEGEYNEEKDEFVSFKGIEYLKRSKEKD